MCAPPTESGEGAACFIRVTGSVANAGSKPLLGFLHQSGTPGFLVRPGWEEPTEREENLGRKLITVEE